MPDSKHDNRPGEGTKKQRAQAKRAAGRRARHAALKAAIASEAASPGADTTVDASDTPKTASALPSILYRKRRSSVISETGLSPSDQQFNDYRRISGPGTVHVVDKDTEEPHIVVRITHYATMTSEDWVDFGPELSEDGSEIAGIYQRRSRELAPMMLKNALNVSYTSKNFHDPAHDVSDVTSGIWTPSGRFRNLGADRFFYDTRYRILVDFATVDGMVEVICTRP